jgi:hypothetical protein
MCLAAAISKWMGSWKEKRWNTVFVGRYNRLALAVAFGALKEHTMELKAIRHSERLTDIHQLCDSRRMLWQRLFEFVSLFVFVLSIVYLDSVVCNSLFKNSVFEDTTATRISLSWQPAFGASGVRDSFSSSDCNCTIPSKLSRHEESDWNEIKSKCVSAIEQEVSTCPFAKSEPRTYQCPHRMEALLNDVVRSADDAQDSAQVNGALDTAHVMIAEDAQGQAVIDNRRGRSCVARGLEVVRCSNYYRKTMQSDTPETLKATTKVEADMQVVSDLSVLGSWKRWKNKWSNARLPEAEASNFRKKMRSDTSETL